MNRILVFVPLCLLLSLYASFLKLSARLARRSRIEWKHAFAFAAFIGILTILGRVLVVSIGMMGALPLPVAILLTGGVHLGLGGWFFSSRARNTEGDPVGWGRAAAIVARAIGFSLLVVFLVVWAFLAIGSAFTPRP